MKIACGMKRINLLTIRMYDGLLFASIKNPIMLFPCINATCYQISFTESAIEPLTTIEAPVFSTKYIFSSFCRMTRRILFINKN